MRDPELGRCLPANQPPPASSPNAVVLPAGISVAHVRLKKAPNGWTLTAGENGCTVAGAALKPGQDAVVTVVVAQPARRPAAAAGSGGACVVGIAAGLDAAGGRR
jgi:hypothetical protein